MTTPLHITRLARWILNFNVSAIPQEAIELAKHSILDSIGCALAAASDQAIQNILRSVDDLGGKAVCTVIGTPNRTAVVNAVLANGILIRALDFNDYLVMNPNDGTRLGGHPSDCIAVALSVGQWQKSSGMDVLGMTLMGYEMFGRLRKLARQDQKWDSVTAFGLVAPAIAGRLMGLNEEQVSHALAISSAHCATLGAVRRGQLSAAKFLASPIVQQTGTLSALLASRGATGPLNIFEDACGLTRDVMPEQDPAILTRPLGSKYLIEGVAIKSFPSFDISQAAIAAAIKMKADFGFAPGDMDVIEVTLNDHPRVHKLVSYEERRRPTSRETADHSVYFLVAVALLDGAVTHRQFENERWVDPGVQALMDKIIIHTDKSWNKRAPNSFPCRLRVVTRNKEERTVEVSYAPGHPHNRLSVPQMKEKFSGCVRNLLDDNRRDTVFQTILEFNSLPSVDILMKQLILS